MSYEGQMRGMPIPHNRLATMTWSFNDISNHRNIVGV
jgi:hypothetical protein